MERPAKLRAINLVTASVRRHKPAGNPQAGNRVLTHAHGDDFQRVDHVLGADIHDDRLADGDVDLIEQLHVVLAVRVGRIHAKDVVELDEFHVLPAEFAIEAGVTGVPGVLLGDDLNNGGIFRRRKFIHGLGPQRHGDEDQQHGLDAGDGEFDIGRGVAFDPDIIGLGLARAAEAVHGIEKINDPADEQHDHQPVDVDDQVVNVLAVLRGQRRQAEDMFAKPLFHTSVGVLVTGLMPAAVSLRMI